jgi:hypothetical protein
LTFYASHKIWLAVKETLKKDVRGKKRQIGVKTRCRITKNKTTGRQGEVEFPIYYSYGIDDVSSCVEFLLDEGYWKGPTKSIVTDLNFTGSFTNLLKHIEENGLESEIASRCQSVWDELTAATKVQRKKKYE